MKQWFELPVNKTQSPKGMLHYYNCILYNVILHLFLFLQNEQQQ